MKLRVQHISILAITIITLFPIEVLGQNYFTMGSTATEVKRVQGQPDEVDRYPASGYEVWTYGYSRVQFSLRSGRVSEWDNSGNLRVKYLSGSNVTESRVFTEGSHKDDVLRLQGTPDEINKYPASGYEVWTYGYSRVNISMRTGKVLEWDNSGNLKAGMVAGTNITNRNTFSKGSHKDDVIRLQGTPDEIDKYPATGYELWKYGNSRVEISLVEDIVVDFDNSGNLIVDYSPSNFERKIAYHNKVDNATLYYDENKSFSNVFSLDLGDEEDVYGVIDEGVIYLYDEEFKPLNTYAYYDEENELEIETIGSTSISYDTQRLSNSITNIDFSGSVSGSGTAMNFGDMTFYDIVTDNGDYIHGSSINFDDMSFDDFYTSEGVSYSGSRMKIGDFTFGDWSTSDGESIYGTSTQIGDFTFHDYTTSDGRTISGTTMDIGGFSFTDYYEY